MNAFLFPSFVGAAIIVLAVVGGARAATSQLTPEQQQVQNAHDAYKACAIKNALRLEPSGDSASDIATAALESCVNEQMDLLAIGFVNNAVHQKSFTVEESDRIDSNMRSAAIAAVVEFRAARSRH